MPLAPGSRLGPYEITAQIGEGGMGVVYKAHDPRLNRAVAVKVLRAAVDADGDRHRRFMHEAKAASALNHPNIVTVYDVDRANDIDFIVMEYVPGRTLEDRIGTRGIGLRDTVKYLTQVADALSAAHGAGIVHRDLKPANIMIGDNDVVKLLDFGIAKLIEPLAVSASAPTVTAGPSPTGQGIVIGTSAYMSPEQARGSHVDQRTDVWAFGCVVYECLTGRRAFAGGSQAEVLAKILETEPDLTTLPATTPLSLRQLIRGCLRKDPSHRVRVLDPVLLELSSETVGATQTRSRMWQVISLGLGAALIAGLGWWLFSPAPGTPAESPLVARLSVPFESAPQPREWDFPALSVSPDGRSLVYVSAGSNGMRQLYFRRMDRTNGVALGGTEGALNPFFAPDGRWVGFFAAGRLKKVSVPEGVVQTLSPAAVAYGGVWSPDNTILFSSGPFAGLARVSAAGGTPEQATAPGAGEAHHRWPAISPDGRVVVYTTSISTGPGLEEPRIVAHSLVSGTRATLPVQATFARFATDGRRLLLVQGGALATVAFDPATLSISGAPTPLMENVMQASTGAAQISVSRSVLAYFEGAPDTRHLVWVDRQGRVSKLDAPPRLYAHPRLSPDEHTIAVTITEPRNDIWTLDLQRGTLSPLTSAGTNNAYPIWTPDGKRITYVSSQDGHPQNVFWKSADGTGVEERLLTSKNNQVTETWLPDGSALVYVERRPPPTGWDILIVSPSGAREPKAFLDTPYCDCTPQISPSGRYLAHTSDESGRQELHIRSFPDPRTKVIVSATGGALAAWRRDERELYYLSGDAMMAVSVTPGPALQLGKPFVLFRGEFAGIQGKNYDVTRDGQRFLMVQTAPRERPKAISVVMNWQEDFEPFRSPTSSR